MGFYAFLDEDDTTENFRGFSVSHERQIVNCRQNIPRHMVFIICFVCYKIPLRYDPKSVKSKMLQFAGIAGKWSGTVP